MGSIKFKLNIFSPVVKRGEEYMFGLNYDFAQKREKTFEFNERQKILVNRLIEGDYVDQQEIEDILGADIYQYFLKNKVIVDYDQDGESIYSRSKAFYELNNFGDVQSKLALKKVLILGCGGIGTHVAWNLAVFGVSEITLVDCDTVEESNLNRQLLYDYTDIGKLKTDVLKDKLCKINKNITINNINIKISNEDQLERLCCSVEYDLIIKALDTPAHFSKWLDSVCNKHKLISLSGITTGLSTLVGPTYLPNKSRGFSEILGIGDQTFERITGSAQSLGVVLYHVSSEVAIEAVKILSGIGKLRYVNKIIVENIFENTLCIITSQKTRRETGAVNKFIKMQINIMIIGLFLLFYSLSHFIPILFLGYFYSICTPNFIYEFEENVVKAIFVNVSIYLLINTIIAFFNFPWSRGNVLSQAISLMLSAFFSISLGIIAACFIGYGIYVLRIKAKKVIVGNVYDSNI